MHHNLPRCFTPSNRILRDMPNTFWLLFLFSPVIYATSSNDVDSFYDYYDGLLDEIQEPGAKRRFDPEFQLEPPTTVSKMAGFFNGKINDLLRTNEEQYIDAIAKYTTPSTQLLSCHRPGKKLNFAEFNQINHYLFLYLKSLTPEHGSFTDHSFIVFTNGVTQDKKNVKLTWEVEVEFDSSLKHYMLSKIHMTGDCSQIPAEFPTGPVESLTDYQNRLRDFLTQDLFFSNTPHQRASYQSFVDEFLISRARVQMCKFDGVVKDRGYFIDYLTKRYRKITVYKDLEFKAEQFSNYQTDYMFTVTVNDQTIDTYRFRVSAQSEVINGWPHWFVDYVEVMCPKILLLNPSQNPRDLQDQFVSHVCGSISPMINAGQSVESRSTFLSHMNSRQDSGFWALICGRGGAPVEYNQFDEWLDSWSSNYKDCKLDSQKIEDYTNFEFICNMKLTRDDLVPVKREFKMKAFYETNQWLVKEVRVGCDV